MQVETDEEQQQDDADFRDGEFRFAPADQAQALRPDDCAGDEIAEHGAQAEAAEQHDEGDGRTEQDHALAQQHVGGAGRFHQASAMRAASAIASKPRRIEAWRAG